MVELDPAEGHREWPAHAVTRAALLPGVLMSSRRLALEPPAGPALAADSSVATSDVPKPAAARSQGTQRRADPNLDICGLLHDLAHIYRDEAKHVAYRRAAAVVAGLDHFITERVQDGRLQKLPRIGPSIERVILEYLETGRSEVVERALATASTDRQRAIARRRAVRENFLSVARARSVLLDDRLHAVSPADYRGDLQQHSLWSDGGESIDEIVEDSIALGQRYAALTDHFGLPVAGGLTAADFARQHADIDEVNARHVDRFTLLKGVEVNIQADGSIDMPFDAMAAMTVVVASPHSQLRREEDQTPRMVAAVRQPGVHILGHPRGRRFNDRAGIRADWDRVFAAAAERQVAIELDGTWERQDIDHALAERALQAGCVFALDSDAHSRRERHFSAIAIAHARLAGIPADRVVNCWPMERLLGWARAVRQG